MRNLHTAGLHKDTKPRAVDGVLACVLGREAAERKQRLTMEPASKNNRKLEVDMTELKSWAGNNFCTCPSARKSSTRVRMVSSPESGG